METIALDTPDEPITIEDAKKYLLLDADVAIEDDPLIDSLISTARQYCENHCDRAFTRQTWQASTDRFHDDLVLPGGTINAIKEITYIDDDGREKTLPPSAYRVSNKGRLNLTHRNEWPRHTVIPDSIKITYTVGPEKTPEDVITAMRLVMATFYENRSEVVIGASVAKMPFGVHALLARHRVIGV